MTFLGKCVSGVLSIVLVAACGSSDTGSSGARVCPNLSGSWTVKGTCLASSCSLTQTGCSFGLECDDGNSFKGSVSGSTLRFAVAGGGPSCTATASFARPGFETVANGSCTGSQGTCSFDALCLSGNCTHAGDPPIGSGGSTGAGGAGVGGQNGGGGVPNPPVFTFQNKVDVLLAVDNSYGMAAKQALLVPALRRLFARLPIGSDVRAGVITSSLGGHGAPVCDQNPHMDDHAHLVGATRSVPSDEPTGFLVMAAGESPEAFATRVGAHVTAAGSDGCGFESQLESVYRFLADPNPPESITLGPCTGAPSAKCATPTGKDLTVLNERAAFLRNDSAIVVLLLTDENDCSIKEGQQYYYAADPDIALPNAASACATDPNDPCCHSCAGATPPGCPADPACSSPTNPAADALNLRCFDQKRRFGVDFLYPTARYVNAFTATTLCLDSATLAAPSGATCQNSAPNPVAGRVFFAGVVGGPWQDFADKNTLADGTTMKVLSRTVFESAGRWDYVLGSGTAAPMDAFMIESIGARSGTNPFVDANPGAANPINGGDYDTRSEDLQLAATFPLRKAVDCSTGACSCDGSLQDPRCQGTTAVAAGVYPSARELQVVKDLGKNGFAASVVPKCELGDGTDPGFGHNPAVDGMVDYFTSLWGAAPNDVASLPSDSACSVTSSGTSGSGLNPPVCDPSYGCIDAF